MRRPATGIATGIALLLVLGACVGGSSSPRSLGGKAGTPAATPQRDEVGELLSALNRAADARPPEGPPQKGGPRVAPQPVEEEDEEEEPPGGNGSGWGRGVGGLGDQSESPPDEIARTNQMTVRGSLDKEIIRRIVRRHFDEVTYCYERELVTKRTLRGRATFEFTISPNGEVTTACLRGSTLHTPRAESCLVTVWRSSG